MAQKKNPRHSKSAQKAKPQPKQKLKSPLDQANEKGWDKVEARDMTAVIMMTLDKLDRQAIEKVSPYLGDEWQENLQEIILTRFDIANDHRHAFSTLPDYLLHHPKTSAKLSRHFAKGLSSMLENAGLDLPRPLHTLAMASFGILHLALVEQWRRDTSKDMSKTMAATAKYVKIFSDGLSFIQAAGSKRASPLRRFRRG